MKSFAVPTREEVSTGNQQIFDNLKKAVGFVPNLYAVMALSEHALGNYLALTSGKSSLKAKEKEVVNLVVSQYNHCLYCLSAHTKFAKLNGFSDDQVLEIRKSQISFDSKLDALAKVVKSIVENKGHADPEILDSFFAAGYTDENLLDAIILVGDKTITNYLHAITKVPVDWEVAPEL